MPTDEVRLRVAILVEGEDVVELVLVEELHDRVKVAGRAGVAVGHEVHLDLCVAVKHGRVMASFGEN